MSEWPDMRGEDNDGLLPGQLGEKQREKGKDSKCEEDFGTKQYHNTREKF